MKFLHIIPSFYSGQDCESIDPLRIAYLRDKWMSISYYLDNRL